MSTIHIYNLIIVTISLTLYPSLSVFSLSLIFTSSTFFLTIISSLYVLYTAAPPGFSSPISNPSTPSSETAKTTTSISPNPANTETDKEKNVLSKEEKKKKKDEEMKTTKDGRDKDSGKDKEKDSGKDGKEKDKDGKDKEAKDSGKDKEKDGKDIKSSTTTSATTAAAGAAAVPAVVKSKGLNANAKVSGALCFLCTLYFSFSLLLSSTTPPPHTPSLSSFFSLSFSSPPLSLSHVHSFFKPFFPSPSSRLLFPLT